MFAIETELGRFVADTEKEAKAALRKAQKAAAAKREEDSRNYQTAMMRAESRAYQFFKLKRTELSNRGGKLPRGYRIIPINSADCSSVSSVYVNYRTEWVVQAENGKAQAHFWGATPIEVVENGCGWCAALVFRNDKSGELIFHAVGVEADQLAVAEVYGLCHDDFQRKETEQ